MSEIAAVEVEPMRQRPGESLMDFTQRVRASLVVEMTAGGLPDDNKDRVTLLATLSDMDSQELNKAKIDAKSASTDVERQAMEIFSRVLDGPARGRNPYARPVIEGVVARVLPQLDDIVDLVPGETDVGVKNNNLPDFAERVGMRMDTIPGMTDKGSEEFAPKEPERNKVQEVPTDEQESTS